MNFEPEKQEIVVIGKSSFFSGFSPPQWRQIGFPRADAETLGNLSTFHFPSLASYWTSSLSGLEEVEERKLKAVNTVDVSRSGED